MMNNNQNDAIKYDILIHNDLEGEIIRQKLHKDNYANSVVDNNDKTVDLYLLYEYSDSVQLNYDNRQYPNMINYVKTGLLTEEEIIQALFYK